MKCVNVMLECNEKGKRLGMKPLFNSGVYNKEENNSYLKPVIVQF